MRARLRYGSSHQRHHRCCPFAIHAVGRALVAIFTMEPVAGTALPQLMPCECAVLGSCAAVAVRPLRQGGQANEGTDWHRGRGRVRQQGRQGREGAGLGDAHDITRWPHLPEGSTSD